MIRSWPGWKLFLAWELRALLFGPQRENAYTCRMLRRWYDKIAVACGSEKPYHVALRGIGRRPWFPDYM